jgi:hypothetical protein
VNRTYKSSVPLDVLREGDDARVKSVMSGKRDPNFYMPRGVEITLQFLTHPSDTSGTGWFPYRVASVKSILVPGTWSTGPLAGTPRADLPWQVRDVVLEDAEVLEVNGAMKYRLGLRPKLEVMPGQVMDIQAEILDARSQNFFDANNSRLRVEWQILTNVVVWDWPDIKKKDGSTATKPEVGQHIGLRLNKAQAENLAGALLVRVKEAKKRGEDLDILQWKWTVEFAAKSSAVTLSMDEKVTEPLDLELYDFNDQIVARMDLFEEHVQAAYADMNGAAPDEAADEEVWGKGTKPDFMEDAESKDLYSMVSTSVLRKKLRDSGVAIPAGTSRAQLIEMAGEALS